MSADETVRPTTEDELKVKRSEKYWDESGDFEIVVSDGVQFKIHKYHLQANSSVFRDMAQMSDAEGAKPIELDDKTFEIGRILDTTFDLVIGRSDYAELSDQDARLVVQFFQKYDFAKTLDLCALHINRALSNGKPCFGAFVKAAYLHEHTLCARAIRDGAKWSWSKTLDPELFGKAVYQGRAWDLRTTPQSCLESLPYEYLWALLRASPKLPPGPMCEKVDTTAMAEEFTRLMSLEGAPKSTATTT